MKDILSKEIRNPRMLCLVLLLAFLPFGARPSYEMFGATIRLSQLAGLLLIFFATPIIYKNRNDWLKPPWVFFLAFITVSLVSGLFAFSRAEAFTTLFFYGFTILLAYAVAATFEIEDSTVYTAVIYAGGLLVIGFCLYQFIGDSLGVSPALTLLMEPYTKAIFGFPRVQGFSLEPLHLANYLIIPLSLALAEYCLNVKRGRLLLIASFLLITLLTVSRGGYLAIGSIVLVASLYLVRIRQFRRLIMLAISIGLAAALSVLLIVGSGSIVNDRMDKTIVPEASLPGLPTQQISAEGNAARLVYHVDSYQSDPSYKDRIKTLKQAVGIGISRPLLGVGPGNFGPFVTKNYPDLYRDPTQTVNNQFAEIFAETGLAGLITMLCFFGWVAYKAISLKVSQHNSTRNIWFFGTLMMLVGFLMQWLTFSTLYITHIWVVVGIFVSIATLKTGGLVDANEKKAKPAKAKAKS